MTDSLTLQVAGRTYEVPSPPAATGLAIQASATIVQVRARNRQLIKAGQEPKPIPPYALERMKRYDDLTSTVEQDSLGPAWQQMIDDGVSLAELQRAGEAAYLWIARADIDAEAAQKIADRGATAFYEGGGADSGPKASTTTGEEPTTSEPGSTSRTTSHPESSPD